MDLAHRWKGFWAGPGGGREVLVIAYPLVLSNMSLTLQIFVDRLFLTWYSPEAVAGAVTGVYTTFALIATFTHTAQYLTTFVAQYVGAGRPHRVGAALWQGIHFSAAAGLLGAVLAPLAVPLFALVGHAPAVQQAEVAYTSILMLGTGPVVLMAALSTFFAGRGQTNVVLFVNIFATGANVVLDALWIFGLAGFPRAGVAGAAWATIASQVVGAAAFAYLIFRAEHRRAYALSAWRPEPGLLWRLMRFGLPAGLQYSLEVLAFAIFMMIVGRIGTVPLAASAIAFNLNLIVFTPMLGLSLGVSALVGRHMGAERPDVAERTVRSAFAMSLAYMVACGGLYLMAPRLLLAPYAMGGDPLALAPIEATAVVLLRFVAVYSIFDMMSLVFAGGLKGAGDTVFPLVATVGLSWAVMIAPAYVACVLGGAGVYTAWTAASVYLALLGLLLRRRFHAGGWKRLRVIEPRLIEADATA